MGGGWYKGGKRRRISVWGCGNNFEGQNIKRGHEGDKVYLSEWVERKLFDG